ncbi:MAG: cell division protein ZipA [Proteobacteria bacterium]|nr:cell division protein ZipA [Pseudomonadota bacterium]
MNIRELIILLLGFAIIAVILRGLYVAFRARRGQIRLAIDKNIPQDVDLGSLEFAELPGGGARIVDRDLEAQAAGLSAVAAANLKAEALDLGAPSEERESIPVLMDAVALAHPSPDATSGQLQFQGEFAQAEEYFAEDEARPVVDDFLAEDASSAEGSESFGAEEDPDAVLLDYDQPQPDVDDLDAEEEENRLRANYDALEAVKPDYPEPEDDLGIDEEPELGSFSMTAGERIGYSAASEPLALPDESDDEIPAEASRSWRQTVFAVFGANKNKEKTEPADPVTPVIEAVGAELESADTEPESETEIDADDAMPATSPAATEPSEVVVINVMAREGHVFAGDDLLKVLLGVGLSFGDMNIFHQRLGAGVKAPVLFSVANILNPGTFDLNHMDAFSTTGVSLFLALPAALNNLEAFEQMLAVARQIQARLDGELKDDHRNVMTAQTMEHYRQRINDFELRCLKAVGGRG